jgi:hypothetical protein
MGHKQRFSSRQTSWRYDLGSDRNFRDRSTSITLQLQQLNITMSCFKQVDLYLNLNIRTALLKNPIEGVHLELQRYILK